MPDLQGGWRVRGVPIAGSSRGGRSDDGCETWPRRFRRSTAASMWRRTCPGYSWQEICLHRGPWSSAMTVSSVIVRVVGPLEHLQPGALRRVDLLEERQRVRRPSDVEGLGDVLDERLGLEVLVVGHVGAGRQVEELGVALDLLVVRQDELHERDGVVDAIAAVRDDDEVAADERRGRARTPRPAGG